MFNTTHTFVGVAIARAGTDKWARNAMITAVVASNFPDIDSIAGLWGTAAYLDHHRGITHSLIGVPIFALILSGVIYLFSEKFWRTYAIALIAMASHPALDFLNSYGVRPFLPWSNRWYYGDIVFIIDPYLDLILLIGILAGSWLSKRKRTATWLSLLAAALYIGARVELHTMAASNVVDRPAQIPQVTKSAVLPEMNPALWLAIIETQEKTTQFPIPAFGNRVDGDDRFVQLTNDPFDEVVIEAATARSAAALLRFARFPVARVERLGSEYRITFLDFRFYRDTTKTALASKVTLDQSMRVTHEQLSFVERIN
jgi:inner membrane protein